MSKDAMEKGLKGEKTTLKPGETKTFEFELKHQVCDIFVIVPLKFVERVNGEYRTKVWIKAFMKGRLVRDRPAYPGRLAIFGGPGKVRVEMKNIDTIPAEVNYGAELPATKTPIETTLK